MKKIQLKDYDESYGIFVDLENVENKGYEYKNEMKVSYEKLLIDHSELLNKECKYYIYCFAGVRSKKAVNILEFYGYDVTWVYR